MTAEDKAKNAGKVALVLEGGSFRGHQIGRANRINLAFCNDSRFMGAASFASTGSIVGYDFIFNDVQDRLDPFDNETFDASPIEMYAVATDMLFGTAAYLPVKSAVLEEAGFDRAVVIVTQDRSYEKKPYEFMPAARARYADYPYLLEAIETSHDRYNIQRMHLWKYEREGRALVVAPQKPVEVGHVEHDSAKLLDLYIQGRQEAKRLLGDIEAFVER